jgi:hypothetical protein
MMWNSALFANKLAGGQPAEFCRKWSPDSSLGCVSSLGGPRGTRVPRPPKSRASMKGAAMSPITDLAQGELEAQISKWNRAVNAGNGALQARMTLKALLLEKERRHVVAFTDEQLAAAIARYQSKVKAGHKGAAMVLERLRGEHVRRTAAPVSREPRIHGPPPQGTARPRNWRLVALFAATGASALIVSVIAGRWYASWRDDSDFAIATKAADPSWQEFEGLIACYERYSTKHPGGAHVREAEDHAAFFRAACAARDAEADSDAAIASYERYLEQCPLGLHAEQARDHVDFLRSALGAQAARDDAVAALAAYEPYVASHPQGAHSAEAQDHVAFLKAALLAGNAGDASRGAIEAYEQYLQPHPQGVHASEARDHVAFLRARQEARVAADDTGAALAAYRRYIALNPTGRHAAEARDHAAFLEAARAGSHARNDTPKAIDAYKEYLAARPDGQHASEARDRIDELTAIKPLGFFVAKEVPGPASFSWNGSSLEQHHPPLRLKDKQRRFLVVVISVRSDQFVPSEAQYRQFKTQDGERDRPKKEPYPPRDHVRFHDPRRFSVILGDGRAYQGEVFGEYSPGLLGSSTEGFIEGTQRRVYYQLPPHADKRETIAIGVVLAAQDCEAPFRVVLDDRPPLDVPAKQMAIPRAR